VTQLQPETAKGGGKNKRGGGSDQGVSGTHISYDRSQPSALIVVGCHRRKKGRESDQLRGLVSGLEGNPTGFLADSKVRREGNGRVSIDTTRD